MNAKEFYNKRLSENHMLGSVELMEEYAEYKLKEVHLPDVMGRIKMVSYGWGEGSTFFQIGSCVEKEKIANIEREEKYIGKGYYNDLTIVCYVAYSESGKRLRVVNEGANVEVMYCP